MSNQHARSVALILNIKSKHVSPHFHVKLDPLFTTVNPKFENLAPDINWQAGFKYPIVSGTLTPRNGFQVYTHFKFR
jgi:hypothetical protein